MALSGILSLLACSHETRGDTRSPTVSGGTESAGWDGSILAHGLCMAKDTKFNNACDEVH